MHKRLAAMPESQVVAVTSIAIDGDVSFTRVGVDKDDGDASLAGHCLDLRVGIVVGDGCEDSAVVGDLALDRLEGSDQVGEVGSSRTPAHGQGAVVATAIGAPVGAVLILASVGAEYSCPLLVAAKGEYARVLEKNGGLCGTAANAAEVVHADINVLVDELVTNLAEVVFVSIRVSLPAVKVDGDGLVKTDVVVCGHDTNSRVIETPLGQGAVEDRDGKVRSPERLARVEVGVSWHGHVQTGKGGGNTRVLSVPVGHDESLEAELTLQDVVLEVRVLADLRIVDLVVGAHDGASTGADGVGKRPEVQLVERLVVDVGADGIDKAKVLKDAGLAEVLLLVHEEVLGAGNDACILDTTDGVGNSNARQDGVRREAFPVALVIRQRQSHMLGEFSTYTSLGVAAKRTNGRTELDIDTLCAVFLAHLVSTLVELATIP